MNDMLPDDPNSKSSVCVEKAFEIWEETKDKRSAQLIFCDLSTPKGDGTFNVYEDISMNSEAVSKLEQLIGAFPEAEVIGNLPGREGQNRNAWKNFIASRKRSENAGQEGNARHSGQDLQPRKQ